MHDKWQQAQRLFHEVADLPPRQRRERLAAACPDDETLWAEVESLVACEQGRPHFMDVPPLGTGFTIRSPDLLEDEPPDPLLGCLIGPYRLVQRIAAGGMGVVYLAVRADRQYEGRVAVKVIKQGMDSEQVLRRFRQERQTLADLDHANIAKLLDGGMTEQGRPFLVMEYIQGRPIDVFCDDGRLPMAERLTLFETVCSAVQYAHQHLVIHRDLKPGNILVTDEGVPKLLDFGLAKVLSDEPTDGTSGLTIAGSRQLTYEFASPEQLSGQCMTTRSDVYSLGVILYRMLAGHHPHRLRHLPPAEIQRIVCETDPQPPSVAATLVERTTNVEGEVYREITPDSVARARGLTPIALRRGLRGDLDNIVLKAMHREPQRRYASVEQLSDDLGRYRAGRPVRARRDTIAYRTSKFVRRNRLGLLASLMIVLAILATGVSFARHSYDALLRQHAVCASLDRARRAEHLAAQEAWRAQAEAATAKRALIALEQARRERQPLAGAGLQYPPADQDLPDMPAGGGHSDSAVRPNPPASVGGPEASRSSHRTRRAGSGAADAMWPSRALRLESPARSPVSPLSPEAIGTHYLDFSPYTAAPALLEPR